MGRNREEGCITETPADCLIQPGAVVGWVYGPGALSPFRCGEGCVIRAKSIVYADVVFGDDVQTGHFSLVRERTTVGSHVVIGSGVVIDGYAELGNYVKIETHAYIPTHVRIGNYVFIGPNAVLTNDKYPLRRRTAYQPRGPILEDNVTLGANCTVLPGVRIGEGSMVAAGAVVTKDVPPWSLVSGKPGEIRPLPLELREENRAKSWLK